MELVITCKLYEIPLAGWRRTNSQWDFNFKIAIA